MRGSADGRSPSRGRATASLCSHPHDRGRLGSTRSHGLPMRTVAMVIYGMRTSRCSSTVRQTTGGRASPSRGRGRSTFLERGSEREENLDPRGPVGRGSRKPRVGQHVRDRIAEDVGHRAPREHGKNTAKDGLVIGLPRVASRSTRRALQSLQRDGALVAQIAVVPAEDALDVAASFFVGRDPVVAHHRALARVVGGDGEDEIAVEGVC